MTSTVTVTRDPVCPFARDSVVRIQIVDLLTIIQYAPVNQVFYLNKENLIWGQI